MVAREYLSQAKHRTVRTRLGIRWRQVCEWQFHRLMRRNSSLCESDGLMPRCYAKKWRRSAKRWDSPSWYGQPRCSSFRTSTPQQLPLKCAGWPSVHENGGRYRRDRSILIGERMPDRHKSLRKEVDHHGPLPAIICPDSNRKQPSSDDAGSRSTKRISVQLELDVVGIFRASGRGWEKRVSQALREWLGSPWI